MTVIPSSDTLHLRDALKNRCFAPRASISASIAMLHLLDALDFRCFGLDCRLVQERLMLHLPDALPPATIYSTRPARAAISASSGSLPKRARLIAAFGSCFTTRLHFSHWYDSFAVGGFKWSQ